VRSAKPGEAFCASGIVKIFLGSISPHHRDRPARLFWDQRGGGYPPPSQMQGGGGYATAQAKGGGGGTRHPPPAMGLFRNLRVSPKKVRPRCSVSSSSSRRAAAECWTFHSKGFAVQLQTHQHRIGIQNLSIDLKFLWEERFHQLLNVAI